MGSDNRGRAARAALHPPAATSWDVGGVKEPAGASLSHLFPHERPHDTTDVQKPDPSLIYIPNLPQNEISNNLNAFRQNTRTKATKNVYTLSCLFALSFLYNQNTGCSGLLLFKFTRNFICISSKRVQNTFLPFFTNKIRIQTALTNSLKVNVV